MTLSEVYSMLDAKFSGKVAYKSFPIGNVPALPYVVYFCDYTDNFGADNIVYTPYQHINIELYSAQKDEASEAKIETALTSNDIFYEKTFEDFIDSEQLYEVVYEIKILKG